MSTQQQVDLAGLALQRFAENRLAIEAKNRDDAAAEKRRREDRLVMKLGNALGPDLAEQLGLVHTAEDRYPIEWVKGHGQHEHPELELAGLAFAGLTHDSNLNLVLVCSRCGDSILRPVGSIVAIGRELASPDHPQGDCQPEVEERQRKAQEQQAAWAASQAELAPEEQDKAEPRLTISGDTLGDVIAEAVSRIAWESSR